MTQSLPILNANLLTHSSEQTFKTCARKYWLSYVMGLRPAHQHDALRLGSAFHAGLEAFKSGGDEMQSADAVRNAYAESKCPPWLMPQEFHVEEETAVAMVRAYVRRYAGDRIVKFLAVELPFDLPLINPHTGREHPTYRNAGKIDGIAELPDGRIAIIEHKTVGEDISPGADYWKKMMMDAQISRYWLAAHAMGYDIQTVIYDATRKPEIKPKAISKADRAIATSEGDYHGFALIRMCPERETPAMFGARLLDDMTTRPDFYFNRVEIPRLDSDLREFDLDRWAIIKQITQCELDGHWPRNTGACVGFGQCTYLDVCRGLRGDPNEGAPDGFYRIENLHPELTPAVVPERNEA